MKRIIIAIALVCLLASSANAGGFLNLSIGRSGFFGGNRVVRQQVFAQPRVVQQRVFVQPQFHQQRFFAAPVYSQGFQSFGSFGYGGGFNSGYGVQTFGAGGGCGQFLGFGY